MSCLPSSCHVHALEVIKHLDVCTMRLHELRRLQNKLHLLYAHNAM